MRLRLKQITHLLGNKVVFYMLSRYVVYFIQFIVSVFCAVKMGPYYYGLWGFIVLLTGYFARINFGIPNSTTILLVKYKESAEQSKIIQSSSILITMVMSFGVIFFGLYHYLFQYGFTDKYPIGWLFYVVCIIAIITYFNQLFTNIYRVKGKITPITISQSVTPFLLLISILIGTGKDLLVLFTLSYLIGSMISLLIFIFGKQINASIRPNREYIRLILKSGFFLFLYNCCFYLIILSTRSVVSSYYAVELFGYFTFAYALADAVILLLDAFSYLIFPKLIDKFNTKDITQVKQTLEVLRVNYMSLCHLMMYIAFLVFPIFTHFMPQYNGALTSMYFVAFALLLYSNSYGYSTYLMAQNRHKTLSLISIVALLVNVLLALFLAEILKCNFEYVICATMISYFLFSFLCVVLGRKQMNESNGFFVCMKECFPLKLFIPFAIAFIIILAGIHSLVFIPLIVFVFLNFNVIKQIFASIKMVLNNPQITDVKGIKD